MASIMLVLRGATDFQKAPIVMLFVLLSELITSKVNVISMVGIVYVKVLDTDIIPLPISPMLTNGHLYGGTLILSLQPFNELCYSHIVIVSTKGYSVRRVQPQRVHQGSKRFARSAHLHHIH